MTKIIAYIGGIGSGKTLSMVKYAYEKYLSGRDIYSNLRLNFPDKKGSGKIEYLNGKFFKDYTTSKFNVRNAVILIDEAHVFLSCRNSMSNTNKIFSRFITQARKRSVDMVYTTQDKSALLFIDSGQVDKNLRRLTDFIVFCNNLNKTFSGGKEYFVQTMHDNYGIKLSMKKFLGNPYFKLFDTNEIISFDD